MTTWDTITDWVENLPENIAEAAESSADVVASVASEGWTWGSSVVESAAEAVTESITQAATDVVNGLAYTGKAAVTAAGEMITKIAEMTPELAAIAASPFKSVWNWAKWWLGAALVLTGAIVGMKLFQTSKKGAK